LISGLQGAGAKLVLSDDRHLIMDLREAAAKLKATETQEQFKDHVDHWINSVTLSWAGGFYPEERNAQGKSFRWSINQSGVVFNNFSEEKRSVVFEFDLASESSGMVFASTNNKQWELGSGTIPTHHKLEFEIDGGSAVTLSFKSNFAKVNMPNNTRDLYFYILDPSIKDATLTE